MWLYVPSTASASAPEAVASTSALSWPSHALASSAWWRGKPSPFPTWYQRCSKVFWLQRLCGVMPDPSEAAHGVALWMASLAAFHVSPTASPESASGAMTSATCGPSPGASSSSPAPGGCSSKTSAGCSPAAARSAFTETFNAWASRLRAASSERRRSARRMSESVCSSSAWPTPNASDGDKAPNHFSRGPSNPSLPSAAKTWATPRASDGEKGGPNQSFGAGGVPLVAQASKWSTPSVADVTGGRTSRSGDRKNELLLNSQAKSLSSLQDLATNSVGGLPSTDRRTLNPLFVEWLMGWPPGWTLAGWTDFACSATELSRFKQRMRCALSHLTSHAAPPAQLSLFS
jgi:hypothetical protein